MRLLKLVSIVASVLLLAEGSLGQGCSTWNYQPPGSQLTAPYSDTAYHVWGSHSMNAFHTAMCTYQSTGGLNTSCGGYLTVGDIPTAKDTGVVWSLGEHVGGIVDVSGSSGGIGIPLTATAKAGVAVESCLLGVCSFSVSFTGVGGIGVSKGSPIWTKEDDYTASCVVERNGCPLILDVTGEGFHLTDAANGVATDMVIPGHRIRFAWTEKGSHNAFLWLDNHLFGNWTDQPPSENPNGFAALAVYDSNADGVIDSKDPVFKDLRLWIDSNHDGVVQPDELFTLSSLGVYSIALPYGQDKYVDEFGNHFRYRGHLRSAAANVDRTIYDVWLSTN